MPIILGTPQPLDELTNNTYTPETGNSNRAVVAIFTTMAALPTRTLTSVTLGGVSLQKAVEFAFSDPNSQDFYIAVYYLLEADIPVGSNLAWAANWSGTMLGDESFGVIYTLGDANQSAPYTQSSGHYAELSANETDTIQSADNSIVLGAYIIRSPATLTQNPIGGFTQRRQGPDPVSNVYQTAIVDKQVVTGAVETWGYSPPSGKDTAIASIVFQDVAAVTVTSVDGDNDVYPGQTGVVISCANAGASQGTGVVVFSPTDDINDANASTQTVTSWSDSSITITVVQGGLPFGNFYAFVKNDAGASNASGFVATLSSATGYSNITLVAIDPDGLASNFPGLAISDQIEWSTTSAQGGTVTVNNDGTWNIGSYPGSIPDTDFFQARAWDQTDYTWTGYNNIIQGLVVYSGAAVVRRVKARRKNY